MGGVVTTPYGTHQRPSWGILAAWTGSLDAEGVGGGSPATRLKIDLHASSPFPILPARALARAEREERVGSASTALR